MGSINKYVPSAYGYVTKFGFMIRDAATTLNVSSTAVAAFIVKEHNNYLTLTGVEFAKDRGSDVYVGGYSLLRNADAKLRAQYDEAS